MKKTKLLDTFQIVGFVISAAISITLVVAKQDEIASVTLGFVLAVLIQLFDLQLRQAESENRLLRANTLGKELFKDEWLSQHVQEIVTDYCKARDHWFELFKLRAIGAITECHRVLRSLAEGEMGVDSRSPYTFAFEGIKHARFSVKSVSAGSLSGWRNPRIEKYLNENVNAIQRGVKFSRIFITPRQEAKENVDIFREHQNKGIEVYVLFANNLPREYNESFTIMDDRAVVLRERISDGTTRERAITTKLSEVERMIERYKILLFYAHKLDEVGKDLS